METLVIDTDAVRRRLLEKILEEHGHTAVAHSSVEAALDAHDRAPFPLVLTSRWLGPTDGLDVCRRIRARPSPSTFLIVLAWHDASDDVQAIIAAGADDYVTAPTDLDLLSLRVAFATRQVERAWTSALTVRTAMAALDQTTRTSAEVVMRLAQAQRPPAAPWDDAADGIPLGLEQTPPCSRFSPPSSLDDCDGIPMGLEHTPSATAPIDETRGRAPDTESGPHDTPEGRGSRLENDLPIDAADGRRCSDGISQLPEMYQR